MFHIYPCHRQGGKWLWHCEQLRRRIGLFNGKRVVGIVTDALSAPADAVRAALDGLGCEFVEMPNDPDLREVQTFGSLFSRVETLDPGHVTLWAHAKGTWQGWGAIPLWVDALYSTMLDHWPVVRRVLQQFPVAGSFKRNWPSWRRSPSQFHYSGSWFFFRNRDLFSKPDWRRIEGLHAPGEPFAWGGIESYPSLHWPVEQAGTVFFEWKEPGLGPYDPAFWNARVAPALAAWRQLHAGERTALPPEPAPAHNAPVP